MTHIDLHTHSSYSHDGEVPPLKLLEMARDAGVSHLAIADHNRVDAQEEALAAAADYAVTLHPCVELDCVYRDTPLHVLGYFIDWRAPTYKEYWEGVKSRKAKTNVRKVELIQGIGFHVDTDALFAKTRDGVLSSVAIAEAVLTDPRNRNNPELRPYREGGEKATDPLIHFSWKYLNRGGPAYVSSGTPSLADAVRLIRDTGGAPILAHPGANLKGREDYLPEILDHGVVAVEAYCNYHDAEQARFWRKAAEERGVPFTCGSDFHGSVKPSIAMGRHGADGFEERILESFLQLKNEWVLA